MMVASGHTATNTPDLFRTPKLTVAGPRQYDRGGPDRKPLGCCQLFAATLLTVDRSDATLWYTVANGISYHLWYLTFRQGRFCRTFLLQFFSRSIIKKSPQNHPILVAMPQTNITSVLDEFVDVTFGSSSLTVLILESFSGLFQNLFFAKVLNSIKK